MVCGLWDSLRPELTVGPFCVPWPMYEGTTHQDDMDPDSWLEVFQTLQVALIWAAKQHEGAMATDSDGCTLDTRTQILPSDDDFLL